MNSAAKMKTSDRVCPLCGSGALADDKFCRHCGTRQHAETEEFEASEALNPTMDLEQSSPYATAPLQPDDPYRTISGPLVRSVTGRLAGKKTARLKSRWGKGVILALISIPIWLMIVLLSPFDAYAAARATVEQH